MEDDLGHGTGEEGEVGFGGDHERGGGGQGDGFYDGGEDKGDYK